MPRSDTAVNVYTNNYMNKLKLSIPVHSIKPLFTIQHKQYLTNKMSIA